MIAKSPKPEDVGCFLLAVVGVCLALVSTPAVAAQEATNYDAKVETLLARMTLEEKIGQMMQVDMDALKDKSDIKKYFLGSMLSGASADPPDITAKGWAAAVEEYESWAFKTRLKIPLLYAIDAVHGHNNVDGAVVFPHNIGMGATRNPGLIERAARITAIEVAATGIRWAFAPCIAVARDPRWGRTYESFGETPEMAEALGAAEVRGFQGESLANPTSVLACAKHFLGDGGTYNGVDQGDTRCDEATLRRIHLPGYIAAIKAGVGSIMVSYSSWNGKKMHGNRYLLTDVLKQELGFQGIVISDFGGIDQLSKDYRLDVETSINAGIDMVMIPSGPGSKNNYDEFARDLKALVEEGRVPESRIDDAVRRVLKIKFRLGLFDEPFADRRLLTSVGCPEHRVVARQCVQQSLVLLKNSNHALPLDKKLKKLLVVGKAACDLGIQCGGWTIDWQGRTGEVMKGGTTLLAAIRQTVAPQTQVIYTPSVTGITGADAAIVVVGELPYAESNGDRKDLQLSPDDVTLVEAVKNTGVPVVTVLFSGRPLILGQALKSSDAFIAAWLPGTEGQGVADVLFGDEKPTGRLPCTWPGTNEELSHSLGDIARAQPQFGYGFGLTYGATLGPERRMARGQPQAE